MMKDKMPKLLSDVIEENTYDIDVITKKLKIPWLKLDMPFDRPSDYELASVYSSNDWREKWQLPDTKKRSYQVAGWSGDVMFGPTDWDTFIGLCEKEYDPQIVTKTADVSILETK